ncbi:MAG TPA: DUF3613 domain-containing protein [Stenotrophobium sp.]|jgi:hypothetical protein|nr:DUF3613 domain-containing protein [Stenotrophobium sp.]
MKRILSCLLLLLPLSAWAASNADAPYHVGDEVRAWTALQDSNSASVDTVRPMPGEISDLIYARYLKSFEQAIPEHFDRESFVGNGGGSQ